VKTQALDNIFKISLWLLLSPQSYSLNKLIALNAIFWCCLEKRLPLRIDFNDYTTKLVAGDTIKLYVKGKVMETGQLFVTHQTRAQGFGESV